MESSAPDIVTLRGEKTRLERLKRAQVLVQTQMEKEPSRREQKRESARKARERAIYTKKAVRIKEERAEKRKQCQIPCGKLF